MSTRLCAEFIHDYESKCQMNEIDDIEQLLQQYGSDRRQQQEAAEHLRLMARRQARRRMAVASVALLLLAAGAIGYRLQQPKPQGPMMAECVTKPSVAQHEAVTGGGQVLEKRAVDVCEAKPSPHHKSKPSPSHEAKAVVPPMAIDEQLLAPREAFVAEAPLPNLGLTDTVIVPRAIEPSIERSQELQAYNMLPTQPLRAMGEAAAELEQSLSQPSRWSLTAAVGTAMMGGMASGEEILAQNVFAANEPYSLAYAVPNNSLQAKVGVACQVWQEERQRLSVGLVLDGYAQQTDVHFQDREYYTCYSSNPYTTAGNDGLITTSNTTNEIYSKNIMSLFVGLPLSYDFYPRGAGKLGCQLSLTPARSLAATPSKYALINPWKLTFGVGVLFPRGFVDEVSLTANVLPLYQNNTMHEFGILIGF